MNDPLLIAVMGAESTGKTTLCAQLARALDGLYVPEYLRTFCELNGRVPRTDEQRAVMQQQMDNELTAREAARRLGLPYVFCDSTPLTTIIYSEMLFNDSSLYDKAVAHHRLFATTLFLQPDIGWKADGVRDGAHVQGPVTELVRARLDQYNLPYVQISGNGQARLQCALSALGH
jgi:nicotinamide riboside kinase